MRPLRFFATATVFGLMILLIAPTESQATVIMSEEVFSVTPTAPGPSETVRIGLKNTYQLPSGSSLLWFIDGVESTTNYNRPAIDLVTKPAGGITEVRAVLETPNDTETYTVLIAPTRVDLLINANSHTPNFYQGRSLPSLGSTFTAQALVFTDETGPLTYRWTVNGKNINQSVGNNNSSIQYKLGSLYEAKVVVRVYNTTGTLIATESVKFIPTEPEILFYESNPLRGLIPNVLPNPYRFLNHEMTLRGEPYFFSTNTDDLKVDWKVDRTKLESNEDPFELSLVKTRESGSAVIRLKIINTDDHLTSDEADITITY